MLCGTCLQSWETQERRRRREKETAVREARVAQEAAELDVRRQADRERRDRLVALPAATVSDLLRYLAHGRGQLAPTDWSLREGVRLEPVAFAALPELLIAVGYRPPRGTYPPRFRLLRGPDLSSYPGSTALP